MAEKMTKHSVFLEGVRDGIPIALGYFAVAFSLGIAARNAGLTAFQGFVASTLCTASAGEYALFTMIGAGATYLETAILTLITNARYFLMSCALSQKIDPKMPNYHWFLFGAAVTDEIFGISIARPGYLDPRYNYGAMAAAVPAWALGTALGILMGNWLPARVVSALSVALYGMFLAIIIPPMKESLGVPDRPVGIDPTGLCAVHSVDEVETVLIRHVEQGGGQRVGQPGIAGADRDGYVPVFRV